jgi:hypothetical protein
MYSVSTKSLAALRRRRRRTEPRREEVNMRVEKIT